MASYDLGDIVPLGVTITDAAGVNANATTVVCTVTAPDGTTSTPTVTNTATGLYDADFIPAQQGRHVVRWVATGTNACAFTDEFAVRDLTQLPVVSYSDALAHLNIPAANVSEDELRRFIDVASDMAEQYVGRVLGRKTFTSESYAGNVDHIVLRNPCVLNIVSVYERGVLLSAGDYQLDPSGQRLWRITTTSLGYGAVGVWAPGVDSVVVTYTAGYLITPPAVQQGVLEILRHLWETQRGAVNVMSRNDDSYSGGSGFALPRRAEQLLDPASLPGLA